jgi:hypothetical protein
MLLDKVKKSLLPFQEGLIRRLCCICSESCRRSGRSHSLWDISTTNSARTPKKKSCLFEKLRKSWLFLFIWVRKMSVPMPLNTNLTLKRRAEGCDMVFLKIRRKNMVFPKSLQGTPSTIRQRLFSSGFSEGVVCPG